MPGAVRVWTFGSPMPGPAPQGRLVYRTTDWSLDIGHLSHANARSDVPVKKQYACGAQGTRLAVRAQTRSCASASTRSQRALVVAPTMTDLDAAGGGASDYTKLPKGNLDVTGRYFIWSSNVGRKRLDVFVVKVPSELLVARAEPVPPDEEAPAVAVTAPATGAPVHGTIALTVSASDNVAVAGVQYKLSGTKLGAEVTAPPFSLTWTTAAVADGVYKIKAVARDAAGNVGTSPGVAITVSNDRANVLWSQRRERDRRRSVAREDGWLRRLRRRRRDLGSDDRRRRLRGIPSLRDELAPDRRPRQECDGDAGDAGQVRLRAPAGAASPRCGRMVRTAPKPRSRPATSSGSRSPAWR